MALVLGLVSCQNDPDEMNVSLGGEQEVMLTVSLPEATRADSAVGALDNDVLEDYDLRYILEVYYGEKCNRFVQTSTSTSAVFPVRLAPGRTYTFVVWADFVTKGADAEQDIDLFYETSAGLKAIQIVEENWTPMVEARDAYVGSKTIADFQTSSNLEMTLTRPFAKVRVVSTDIEQLRGVGIVPTTAQATYSQNMYSKFNAATGVASDAATKTYTFAYANVDSYEEITDSKLTIFSDYIFVPAEGVAKFTLEVWDGETPARSIKQNNFNTDIFVEKNMVTSIVGDVLTTGGNVKVTIDGDLGEKETITVVDNAQSLQDAINNAPDGEETIIELGGDIDLNDLFGISTLSTRAGEPAYALLVDADKEVVLDLKGFTISQSKECKASYSMIHNNGNLTIIDSSEAKSGKISFKDTSAGDPSFGWGSYTISNYGGTLDVENGTIEHLGEQNTATEVKHMICAIFQYSGSTTINGGTISTPTYRSVRLWHGDMTINGGNFEGQLWVQAVANTSNLTINGGTFAPRGKDGSSVFVTNSQYDVKFAVTGGHFTTKIGASKPFGCITAGTFTTEAKEGTNIALVNDDYAWVETENGLWTVERKADVAKIGEVGYTSLAKAVAAVKDGETITLARDIIFDENSRQSSGGTWYEGLYYIGNKSFTIDLNGKTISQNGAVNDYLFLFKNDTNTENTINFINGTINAGTSAYCALCTSTTSTAKITINLENVNLNGNNSNGAVAKIRGGAELNVNAGTVITGADSYVGIEAYGATVNIYEGAEIYQNGKSSYVGSLVGVSGNGTVNVYGGKGTSAQGGFIAMTSGGTVNVSGGEWTANTDGTYANDNKGVLIAQSASGAKSVVNVTGGTFNGGYNCYGDAAGDAQININGGNFNANPSAYLTVGCEATESNGIWTVRVVSEAKIGEMAYETLEAAAEAAENGDTITLLRNLEVAETIVIPESKEIVLDLNGHNITSNIAGKPSESFELFSVNGNLEIKGNGTISLTSEDFEWNTSYRYTAINIREKGVVTLGNGVSVICEASKDGSYGMSYAVDIYTTGTLNINGASLHSNYIAVRCFFGNSVVYVNSGSKITSSRNNYGIWLQSSPDAVVTIADDVNYTFANNIYCFN